MPIGEVFDMNVLAVRVLGGAPRKRVHGLIVDPVFITFVDLPDIFEWGSKTACPRSQWATSRIAWRDLRIHQPDAKRNLLMLTGVVEHLAHMVEL